MAVSEAQKRASAKWDKENTKIVSCKIKTKEHAAFKAYAEQHGKTVSGMLLSYIRDCIAEMEQQESTEQNEN